MSKPHTLTIRLTAEQRARLDEATRTMPYAISVTEVVTRGIDLAAQELETMARAIQEQREDTQ